MKAKDRGPAPGRELPLSDREAERWGWYSLAVALLLLSIDAAVALLSKSAAARAETLHNGVDLVAAGSVLLGMKLSKRRSPRFPYGLYKVENIVAVGLGLLTFVSAWEIGRGALVSGRAAEVVDVWMIAGIAASALIPFAYSYLELSAGRRANSPALIAAAREYRVHVLTAGAVLVALVGYRSHLPLDRVAALFIAAFIAWAGWRIIADGMRVLLDASLDPEALEEIRRIVRSQPNVAVVEWITARNSGRYRFVEAAIALRTTELAKAEATTREIEEAIRRSEPSVVRVVIDTHPERRETLLCAVPLADPRGALSASFGEAPFFWLGRFDAAGRRLDEGRVLANPYTRARNAKGIEVARWLVGEKVDRVVARIELRGTGPGYVLAEAGTELRRTQARSLAELEAERGCAPPDAPEGLQARE